MSQKKKTTAQNKRPRKAPSNQTGGTAWGKKAAAAISGKMQSADMKKLILLNFPYIITLFPYTTLFRSPDPYGLGDRKSVV